MAYELPPLPYEYTALEPHISKRTLEFHHDKHHAAYVNNFNAAAKGTDLDRLSIEAVIKATANDPSKAGIFNNAAQAWNHTFYWHSMKPKGGGTPTGELAKKIDSDLGGFAKFVEAFKAAGATQFGSGWAWLVLGGSGLQVISTPNQDSPLSQGLFPIMGNDVWEHAYYLKYQNRRAEYLKAWWNVVNWAEVNKRYAEAKK